MFFQVKTDRPDATADQVLAFDAIAKDKNPGAEKYVNERAQRSRICPALAAEASDIAQLVWAAGDAALKQSWNAQSNTKISAMEVGTKFVAHPHGIYSYKNIDVAYQKRKIVACIVGSLYLRSQSRPLLASTDETAWMDVLDRRAQGTWLISSIATQYANRRQGIGSALLEAVEHRARLANVETVSVAIDGKNPAVEFFQHQGFRMVWRDKLSNGSKVGIIQGWGLMTKRIEQNTTISRRR
ncbi:MAG: GNAT family N-acetyltransferase [Paracoccaceae bacterium]